MNEAKVFIHDSIDKAPQWNEQTHVESVNVGEFHIVRKGTNEGRSTVDIVLIDTDGMKYVAMTTGLIIRLVANLIGEE